MNKFPKCIFAILIAIALVIPVACAQREISPAEQITPAEFETSSLVITPTEAVAGRSIEVTATVENVGGKEGTYNAILKINGRDVETKKVMLAPGETKLISFTLVKSEPGIYQVEIDGLKGTVRFTQPVVPSSQVVKKLGEKKYNLEQTITLKNEGPGIVSRMILRLALVITRHPYQTVMSTNINPSNYRVVKDEYQNSFAEFEYANVGVGEEVSIKAVYQVVVAELDYDLSQCRGSDGKDFLQPEPFIESDNADIVALAGQVAGDKPDVCAKARALYNWVGDSLSYSGYIAGDKGAVWALGNRSGDCTEFSYLLIALSQAVGIPARFVEGLTYHSGTVPLSELKHDWVEVHLPGIGWVPVDPTWGRFKEKREQYFARMSPEHIIVAVGNPLVIAQSFGIDAPFHYFGYNWWWPAEKAEVSHTVSYEIRRAE